MSDGPQRSYAEWEAAAREAAGGRAVSSTEVSLFRRFGKLYATELTAEEWAVLEGEAVQ